MIRLSHFVLSAIAIFSLSMPHSSANETTADVVLRGGTIVTMDRKQPVAKALAVRGDRIAAVGSEEAIDRLIDSQTRIIDLKGKTAIPGFIDSHAHLTGIGRARMQLNLMDVEHWDDIIALVQEAASKGKTGEWILGRGWHQEKWTRSPQPNVDGHPTHDALSAVAPDRPVLLIHASGHLCFANAKAMELAGVNTQTPDPSGGEILKDRDGNPIGIFRESAQGLIRSAYNDSRENWTESERRAELDKQIELAVEECLSKGITSFQDAGSSFETIDRFRHKAEEGTLKMRLWVMIGESNSRLREKLSDYKIIASGNNHLTVRAIKRFMDGALGAHGAWLLEPYNDLPTSSGLNVSSLKDLQETARLAYRHGFQLCMHAIGDRANRETLDLYEKALKGSTTRRWRIEHAQHLHPDDIPRFARLGIIASMQTCHCVSDAPYVIQRLGKKRAREGAYVWRSLIDSGAVLCNGTDGPVEDVDPIANFYAAVTRQTKNGTPFFREQRMTREEALRSYTLDAAYAAFEEEIKGSLSPGKLADITVLSDDLLHVPEEEILQTKILMTIVGGEIRYRRQD